MTKAQIIEQMSEKVTTLTKRQAEVVVNTIFDCIRDSLKNGDKTEIRGFGSFITKKRAAKIGRNIKKNIAVHIPEHYIPAFKPAKEFVAEVKKLQSVKFTFYFMFSSFSYSR